MPHPSEKKSTEVERHFTEVAGDIQDLLIIYRRFPHTESGPQASWVLVDLIDAYFR